ncbi:MAG: HDOD domain-containing protein [Pseudomonadales bacterium]|nr:HDOD domain-containing protein [Pseudomonadales bacterium]
MSVEALLKRVYELPSIPKVVQELIENFSSDSADAETISKNIQSDPVIAAKVLRLANSVRYGAGRKVGSLDAAVVMLGLDTLKTLVVASGVTGTMKDIPGVDMRDFWRNSFMVANICKIIAGNSEACNKEVAFTCGMLSSIGIPLMYLVQREDMYQVEAVIEGGFERASAEKARFGYDNHEVSSQLAKAWKFPEGIVEALANQGKPLEADTVNPYAVIIKLAVHISSQLEAESDLQGVMADLPKELTNMLNVDTYKLFEQLEQLTDSVDDIDELLAA